MVAPTGTVVVILETVEAETTAVVLLNFTTLLAGVGLKFCPLIKTVAPTAPLSGVNPVIAGDDSTLKLVPLVIVIPLTVIEIGPDVAPAGTVAVIVVAVEAVTVAEIPLKETVLLAGVVLKLVPVITMDAPTAPVPGLNPVNVGVAATLKLLLLNTVIPFSASDIFPEVAPTGTVVVMLVEVEAVTMALTPLNVKILLAGVVLKLAPVMVMVAPTAPLAGLKLVMAGVGKT